MVPDETLQYLKQRFGKYASFDAYSGVEWDGPNTVGCMSDTPIFIACREGDLKAVKKLIEMGADVNFKGDLNMTPLHDAVRGGTRRWLMRYCWQAQELMPRMSWPSPQSTSPSATMRRRLLTC